MHNELYRIRILFKTDLMEKAIWRKGECSSMSQHTEEQQDNTEQSRRRKRLLQKKHGAAALAIAAVALFVIPVLAWFYFQKSLLTVTKINEPNPLKIGAGDAKDITQLELSNIDVSESPHEKKVVFCVYSRNEGIQYNLQLAHTTNIGFTYEIYPATKGGSGTTQSQTGVESVEYLGQTYYYDPDTRVSGIYLNKDSPDSTIAMKDGEYHNKTYASDNGNSYTNVQKNAEPLYWKTSEVLKLPVDTDNSYYINYFVLRISWGDTVQNNKETDMVYLMAEAAAGLSSDTMS